MFTDKRLASARGVAAVGASRRALRVSAQAIVFGVGIALLACGSQDESAKSAPKPPAVVEKLSIEDLAIGDGPRMPAPEPDRDHPLSRHLARRSRV